jgi:lysozyme family protein
MRYSEIWPRYAKYWDAMKVSAEWQHNFVADANYAIAHKVTYLVIAEKTGVPWPMLACMHRRESDGDFNTYFGNGQPLSRRTTEEPLNRGPFTGPNAFVNGALDAIKIEGWGTVLDWRLEKQLYYMLLFNGVGSELWGHPSSYVWGGTSIQQPGKWVRDHVWSSTTWDPQPGAAPLLQTISHLDPSVTFTREN